MKRQAICVDLIAGYAAFCPEGSFDEDAIFTREHAQSVVDQKNAGLNPAERTMAALWKVGLVFVDTSTS